MNYIRTDTRASFNHGWMTGITTVSSLLPIVSFFAINACESRWLKVVATSLIVVLCIIGCIELYQFTTKKIKLKTALLYLVLFLLGLSFSIIILTRKCDSQKGAVPAVQNSNNNSGNNSGNNLGNTSIDNSVHVDNSVHNNFSKELPRSLDNKDRRLLSDGLPDRTARVLIMHLAVRTIDTVLSGQVLRYLSALDYEDVHDTPAGALPDGSHEKINIRKEINGEQTVYKVIINPTY